MKYCLVPEMEVTKYTASSINDGRYDENMYETYEEAKEAYIKETKKYKGVYVLYIVSSTTSNTKVEVFNEQTREKIKKDADV